MRFGSVCSGIESASVAWNDLGWRAAWFSEIDPFACRVLYHHYPSVPNYGDANLFGGWPHESVDVIAGGTPCQSFSLAGLRKGLDDPRGNVMLAFVGIVERFRPRWVVWENVPGVLSSNGGRDFGTFLGALEKLGYGWAYRTLDAQFFGVPQRRRRVFVIGCLADQSSAAAVLFERESVRGHTSQTESQSEVQWWNGKSVSQTCDAVLYKGQMMPEKNRFPVLALGEKSYFHPTATTTETARFAELITPSVNVLDRLKTIGMSTVSMPLGSCGRAYLRRATPIEVERLQGFPSGYTDIPGAKDGPRFRALGNAWAVPVARWIGDRIATVNSRIMSA